jgi:agmatine/peptidylarginine deiminase
MLGLDGGAVVSNGEGLCAITRRNLVGADADQPAKVDALMGQLGCEALAILPALAGETTGHADVFVHFFGADVVGVASVTPHESAENAGRMDMAAAILGQAADSLGIDLRVIRVPMPRRDSRVYYSYLNSLDLRDKVLVPHFDGVAPSVEAAAHAAIRTASNRKIVPIDASEMVTSGGALHCLVLGLFLDRTRHLLSGAAIRKAG